MADDPMRIENVRAQRAADEAERDMLREIAREVDGPPLPGIGTLLKRALSQHVTDTGSNPAEGAS